MAYKVFLSVLFVLVSVASGKYFHDAFDTKYSKNDMAIEAPEVHQLLSRSHFSDKSVFKLNHMVKLKLHHHYLYRGYAHYFKTVDVVLPGFHSFFKSLSDDNLEHADRFMKYLNKRGGRNIHDYPIRIPDSCETIEQGLTELDAKRGACICQYISAGITQKIGKAKGCKDTPLEWFNGLQGLEDALISERHINNELLLLHENANDPHLEMFLETHYLGHSVDTISKLANYITQLKKVGAGLGEYVFDKSL
ncbi:soma ferritin-like [Liolophura sinensis]|uniref:soma ferritin-like n=1 Tax=Liolophura sinensis TaxID=3198878 RepID=UPI00315967EC